VVILVVKIIEVLIVAVVTILLLAAVVVTLAVIALVMITVAVTQIWFPVPHDPFHTPLTCKVRMSAGQQGV
jgi:hypothetical protein